MKAAQRQAWTDFMCKKVAGSTVQRFNRSTSGPALNSEAVERFEPLNAGDIARAMMSESAWQAEVTQIATLCGWKHYHTHDSRKSEEGFPDLIMMRPPRLVVPELKKMGEEPKPEQWEWLRLFEACGAEIYVWRPCDFDTVSKVLR